jgi:CRISPR-associated protein Csm5
MINNNPAAAQNYIKNYVSDDRNLNSKKENLSDNYMNILALNNNKNNDAVNNIMRTLSVSDSEPIDILSMTLCKKVDIYVNGESSKNGKVVRECIKPGTKVKFKINIDRSMDGITYDAIVDAINFFSEEYQNKIAAKFELNEKAVKPDYKGKLLLGGGVGYFSKTEVYTTFDYENALKIAVKIMMKNFKNHYHDKDIEKGISPHTIKYTEYGNKFVPFGLCKLSMK